MRRFLLMVAFVVFANAVFADEETYRNLNEILSDTALELSSVGSFYRDNWVAYREIDINRDGVNDYLVAIRGKGYDEVVTSGDRDWAVYLSQPNGGYQSAGGVIVGGSDKFRELPDMPGTYGFVGASHVSSAEVTIYARYYVPGEGWQTKVYGRLNTKPGAEWNPAIPRALREGPVVPFQGGGEMKPSEFLTPEQYAQLTERPYTFFDRYTVWQARLPDGSWDNSGRNYLVVKKTEEVVGNMYGSMADPRKIEYTSCAAYEEDKRLKIIPPETEVVLLCDSNGMDDDSKTNDEAETQPVAAQQKFQPPATKAVEPTQTLPSDNRWIWMLSGIAALLILAGLIIWRRAKSKGNK